MLGAWQGQYRGQGGGARCCDLWTWPYWFKPTGGLLALLVDLKPTGLSRTSKEVPPQLVPLVLHTLTYCHFKLEK